MSFTSHDPNETSLWLVTDLQIPGERRLTLNPIVTRVDNAFGASGRVTELQVTTMDDPVVFSLFFPLWKTFEPYNFVELATSSIPIGRSE